MDDKRSGNDISAHRVKNLIALIMVLYAFPVFMSLAYSYSMPGIANDLRSSMAGLRFMEHIESAARIAGALVFGVLADRFGRKPLLLAAMVMMAVGMLLYSLSGSIVQYASWRFTAVAGGAGMMLILTILGAELASESKRAFVIVLIGFGSIVGVMVGGFLAGTYLDGPERDWRPIFYTFTGLTLAGLVLAWRLLPESPDWRQAIGIPGSPDDRLQRVRLSLHSHWPLLLAYFLMGLVIYWILRGVIPALIDAPSDFARLSSRFSMGSLVSSVLLLALLWRYPCRQLTRYCLMLAAVVTLVAAISPFITATIPVVLFLVSLFCNASIALLRALAIIELPVAVRGVGAGLLVLLMQMANPLASKTGAWLMETTPRFVAIWVLMCLACLVGAWLVVGYTKKVNLYE